MARSWKCDRCQNYYDKATPVREAKVEILDAAIGLVRHRLIVRPQIHVIEHDAAGHESEKGFGLDLCPACTDWVIDHIAKAKGENP